MADGLLNKASIILTPTGYKAGTLYNVAPVVEPYEDFDFARASVASRVNSSGLVEMVGRTLGSELVTNGDFATDSDWTLGGAATIENDALHLESATNEYSYARQDISSLAAKTYKIQLEIKNYVSGACQVGFTGTSPIFKNLNVTADGTYTAYISPNVNGNDLEISREFGGGNFNFDVDNVSVKEIIDTNNIPRINYDSNGDNGHILLEPTSTNLITYSEDFSQWALGSNATLTYESDVVAPDGSLGVYRLTLPAQSGTFIYFPISNSNLRTCSVYAKSASINDEGFNILLNIGSSKFSTNNEWQRFEFTDSGSGNVSFINSGDTFVTDIYIWGAQLEELSYATSYIPTLTGSTVTRATETATGAGSADLINSTEGVLYFELSSFYDDANSLSINDGSSSKRITARVRPDISKIQLVVVGSTDDFSYNSATIDLSINNKIAIVYNNGDYYFYVNGVKSSVQSRGTFNANDFTNLDFNRGGGGEPFYGKCKALAVFDEALSDSELTQLTT